MPCLNFTILSYSAGELVYFLFNTVCLCSAHKEVLRLHYEDYGRCVSEHHLIRVKALLEAPGENKPIMAVANIPLSMPELVVQVSAH